MELSHLIGLEFKGALIGMTFGDGSLSGRVFKTTTISQGYAEMKAKILRNLTEVSVAKYEKSSSSYGMKPIYEVRSRVHPFYQKLRLHTYLDGRKQVTRHAMKSITPLGLLLWYMDDGCLDDAGGGLRFQIHSNCFGEAEHDLIAKMLNDRFGLRFNVRTAYKKHRDKTYYWLYLKAVDRLRFWDMAFAPFLSEIPMEMRYKIPTRENVEKKMASEKHTRFYENIV